MIICIKSANLIDFYQEYMIIFDKLNYLIKLAKLIRKSEYTIGIFEFNDINLN